MADQESSSPGINSIHTTPKNCWTTRQREVLCVLVKFYQNPLSESVLIFNTLFEKELLKCNFTRGICSSSLVTQWHELYRSGSAVFERVQIETLLSDESDRWADLREDIEEAAREIEFPLLKRKFEHLPHPVKFGTRPKRQSDYLLGADLSDLDEDYNDLQCSVACFKEGSPTENTNASISESDTEEVIVPSSSAGPIRSTRRTQQRRQCSNNTFLPSNLRVGPVTPRRKPQLQRRRSRNSNHPQRDTRSNTFTSSSSGKRQSVEMRTPPLLYRYWGSSSQGFNSTTRFVAGLFRDDLQSIPLITSYSQDEIDTMTVNHLRRIETPSPFVSTSETLFSPLHRALHQESTAVVSIIDVSKLDPSTLFSAQKLIGSGDLVFHRNYKYKGHTEWLVWGQIPTSSIVCHFTMDSLFRMIDDFPQIESLLRLSILRKYERTRPAKKNLESSRIKVDETTGHVIGQFLQFIELPEHYIEQVSATILTAWGFEGVRWDGRGRGENYEQRHESYLHGVRMGYALSIERQILPMRPKTEDKEEMIDSSTSQDEMWSSSPIATPDSSPLTRFSREIFPPVTLKVTVPAGQTRQPQSTLAGLKHEMNEDEIGKDESMNIIEWEDVEMEMGQQAMEREVVYIESRSPSHVAKEDAAEQTMKWEEVEMGQQVMGREVVYIESRSPSPVTKDDAAERTMEWEEIYTESTSPSTVMEDDDDDCVMIVDESEITAAGHKEAVDRFMAERNRINCLLNL